MIGVAARLTGVACLTEDGIHAGTPAFRSNIRGPKHAMSVMSLFFGTLWTPRWRSRMEAPENSLRDGLAAALKELNEGHIEIAERMSVELLGSRPTDPATHQLAATVALRRERYFEAERWALSCLALRPLHAPAMLIAGRAARALGDIVRARDWFRRASEAAPDRPEPAFLLCVAQLECADPAAQESARTYHAEFSAQLGRLELNRRRTSQSQSTGSSRSSVRTRLRCFRRPCPRYRPRLGPHEARSYRGGSCGVSCRYGCRSG